MKESIENKIVILKTDSYRVENKFSIPTFSNYTLVYDDENMIGFAVIKHHNKQKMDFIDIFSGENKGSFSFQGFLDNCLVSPNSRILFAHSRVYEKRDYKSYMKNKFYYIDVSSLNLISKAEDDFRFTKGDDLNPIGFTHDSKYFLFYDKNRGIENKSVLLYLPMKNHSKLEVFFNFPYDSGFPHAQQVFTSIHPQTNEVVVGFRNIIMSITIPTGQLKWKKEISDARKIKDRFSPNEINSIKHSPDGKSLAIGMNGDPYIRVYDSNNGDQKSRFFLHN